LTQANLPLPLFSKRGKELRVKNFPLCKGGLRGILKLLRDVVVEKRERVRISRWLEMIRCESFDIATQSLAGE
jgi:hypothetical protein